MISAVESRGVRRRARVTMVVGFLALAAAIATVWMASYTGRTALVASQRAGCIRSSEDRIDVAGFIRAAEQARRKSGETAVAEDYARRAASIEGRVGAPIPDGASRERVGEILTRVCHARFPSARVFGNRGR